MSSTEPTSLPPPGAVGPPAPDPSSRDRSRSREERRRRKRSQPRPPVPEENAEESAPDGEADSTAKGRRVDVRI